MSIIKISISFNYSLFWSKSDPELFDDNFNHKLSDLLNSQAINLKSRLIEPVIERLVSDNSKVRSEPDMERRRCRIINWQKSDKGKAARAKWMMSEKGQAYYERRKLAQKKYQLERYYRLKRIQSSSSRNVAD